MAQHCVGNTEQISAAVRRGVSGTEGWKAAHSVQEEEERQTDAYMDSDGAMTGIKMTIKTEKYD